MPHHISYEIYTVEPCPYRILFNEEFIEYMKEKESFKNSNIYFITKIKKLRFNIDKTIFFEKSSFRTVLELGDKTKSIECSASIYNLIDTFSTIFKTKQEFDKVLNSPNSPLSFQFNKEESKTNLLVVNVKFEDLENYIHLYPENFESICNINFENEPEILYIGQSFRMIDRIQSHKALHKAVSNINDDEEVKIFFLNFKVGYGGKKEQAVINGKMWNYWLNQDRKSDDYKTRIDLIERFLIHFYKPIYNNQHVKADLMNDSRVKGILLNEKIDGLNVGLGVYGFGFGFWSKLQPLKMDLFHFDFNNPEMGYQPGLSFDI